ncbi:MAG: hypothetical protein ACJ76F_04290 [Bacteroidia bacterium]
MNNLAIKAPYMQETTYPRMMIMKVLPLFSGVLFLITTVLQLAIGNPAAFLTGIAALLFLINGIWSVSTPYAMISNTSVALNMGLLASFELPLSDIETIEIESGKVLILVCRNGERKTAKLHGMNSDYREDFIQDLKARIQ